MFGDNDHDYCSCDDNVSNDDGCFDVDACWCNFWLCLILSVCVSRLVCLFLSPAVLSSWCVVSLMFPTSARATTEPLSSFSEPRTTLPA